MIEFNICLLCGYVYEQDLVNDEYIDNNECPCCGMFDTEMEKDSLINVT